MLDAPAGFSGSPDDGVLSGREVEEVRKVFAQIRSLASASDPETRAYLRLLGSRLAELGGQAGASRAGPTRLSEREIDVLGLAGTGMRNEEIATELQISTETVKSYLRSAMSRLDVHSRHDAIAEARALGALP